jgi:SAM-dependent methyltransferase
MFELSLNIRLLLFCLRKYRVKNIFEVVKYFKAKNILELGGPSRFFYKNIPLYQLANRVDCANFGEYTPRDGKIKTGKKQYNYYKNKFGTQYIQDAINLNVIKDLSYDLVISSNCLEHIANPLKALFEWKRVLRKNSYLIIVLPNPKKTADKNRKITKFEHILEDFKKNTTEMDKTHIKEVIEKSAYTIDKISPTKDKFIEMVNNNYKYRILHHHVFDYGLIKQIAKYMGLDLISHGSIKKDDYYILKIS